MVKRLSFSGKSIAITGAGGGLGRALALRFAADGARIAALDKDAAGLDVLRQELEAVPTACLALQCDVSDRAACETSVLAATRHFGGLDVLINNAGISHRSALERTDPNVIRRVMEVNFFGSVNCTQAALPALTTSRGLIIVVSSVAGFAPLIARSGYAASKHALHGFFGSLREEIEPKGIRVMMVCPSFVATRIDRNALGGDGGPVTHAQQVIGTRLSPQLAADRIHAAALANRRLLLLGSTAHLAWWVNRLAPSIYAKGMARRLHGEME